MSTSTVQLRGGPLDGHETAMTDGTLVLMLDGGPEGDSVRYVRQVPTETVVRHKPKLHPSVEHIMQFFSYQHLPQHLQETSKPFCQLAEEMAMHLPANPETTVCLRKLLEAKDAAVRAKLAE